MFVVLEGHDIHKELELVEVRFERHRHIILLLHRTEVVQHFLVRRKLRVVYVNAVLGKLRVYVVNLVDVVLYAAVARFNAIKKNFWDIVDAALAEMGESRSALPAYFTAEDMIEFATGKLTATKITKYQMQFMIVSHNLEMNDRNWLELFNE